MTSEFNSAADPGDNELFVSLLMEHHSRLLGYIRTLIPQRQDAEDLFQRVSITLWQKFAEYDRSREFFPWAAKVAFFTVCNYRRKRYRQRLVFSEELIDIMSQERPQHLEQQEGRLEALLSCVESLAPADQHLLMQMYGERSSIKELAATTGKAVQTLYNRLASLRRDLVGCVQRKTLGGHA